MTWKINKVFFSNFIFSEMIRVILENYKEWEKKKGAKEKRKAIKTDLNEREE